MSRRVALLFALVAASSSLLTPPAQAAEDQACPVINSTTTSFFGPSWSLHWRTTAVLSNTCPSAPGGAVVQYRWRVNGQNEPVAQACVDGTVTEVDLGVREVLASQPRPTVSISHVTYLVDGCPA